MFWAVSCSWTELLTAADRSEGSAEATGQLQCRWRSLQSQRSSWLGARGRLGSHHHILPLPYELNFNDPNTQNLHDFFACCLQTAVCKVIGWLLQDFRSPPATLGYLT